MAAPDHPSIPIICGPTGSGKTAVAVALAREFPLEVVSADSRQIIRYLDIGTAKPTRAEREAVTFHLLDIVDPGQRYSAYRFISDADKVIGSILGAGRIPLVVGGTGLYLRALIEGVVEIENEDLSLREKLEQEMSEAGCDRMYEKLKQIDPDEAARIHPHNRVRVIRALEIYHLTGKSKSDMMASGAYKKSAYHYQYFCLSPPRDKLYRQIDQRVEEMMGDGLLDELKSLVARGLGDQIKKSNVIGYSELLDHLGGNLSLDAAVIKIKQNSRRYAKRQLTWFRAQPACDLFDSAGKLRRAVSDKCLLWRECTDN
ncbi:MAG: tRNA (adenosine(37)-N6)-dimethylallyltransferase MiaA [Candidatus Zixiibacteriota bacterium]|nr:MAG: tRNA (adenosine(37)-N6)-dimethylallyltransferase MiaA [candidate division Zixibacteria bacterium]